MKDIKDISKSIMLKETETIPPKETETIPKETETIPKKIETKITLSSSKVSKKSSIVLIFKNSANLSILSISITEKNKYTIS